MIEMISELSVNNCAYPILQKLCDNADKYGVIIEKSDSGVTLIDAGIRAKGGYLAGEIITEICLGGYGEARLSWSSHKDLDLPSIRVYTDHPSIATLGSQFAGWRINVGDYSAMGSGPARALALQPPDLYEKIGYEDKAKNAILVLETTEEPPREVIEYISSECGVSEEHLFLILVPTSTLAGSTQISGRIVETGVHKLTELGIDPSKIINGTGYSPIAPIHPKFAEAMGRTNDAILYGGVTWYTVEYENEVELKNLIEKASSTNSRSYGKPFSEIFRDAGYDFYKIDPDLFAPALIMVNNINTGNSFIAGRINVEILKKSMGLRI